MKKLLIAVAVLFLLVVVALLAIPALVDTGRFRPMVQTEARKALGRDVTLGDIKLSLFSGGVVVNDVSIAEDPAFGHDAFVQAKSLKVGLEMLPLLTSREVHVTSVALESPQIRLVRNNAGKWNFDSLAKGNSSAKGSAQAPSIASLKVEDGTLTMVQAGKQHAYEHVNVSLKDFSPSSSSPFTVSAEAPGGGSLKVDGRFGPLAAGGITDTPLDAQVNVKGLDLAATGLVSPDSGIAGTVDYQGSLRSDGKQLHSEGKATAQKLKLVKTGAQARVPLDIDYVADLDLAQHKGTISKGDLKMGNSRARLSGTVDTHGDTTALNANLSGHGMAVSDVEGILPAFGLLLPQGTQLQGGTVNTDLSLTGPLDRLVIAGPVDVHDAKLAGFNLKSRASSIGALAGLPSTNDLLIQLLNSKLRVAPEGIRFDGLQMVVPAVGSVSGDGVIGANNSLNFKMRAKLANAGLVGAVSQLTTLGQSKGEVPFLIQGTTSSPIFIPDVAGALTNTAKAPVQDVQGLGNVLGGLFGKKKKK